jgi:hypothetical protein
MNIQELLEQVEMEAATQARHAGLVRKQLIEALQSLLKKAGIDLENKANDPDKNPKLDLALDQLRDGKGGLITNVLWKYLQPHLEYVFSQRLEEISPNTFDIPKWQINVLFDTLAVNYNGEADGNTITINNQLTGRLVANTAKFAVQQALKNQDDPVEKLWSQLREMSETTDWLESDISQPIVADKEPVGNTLYRIISMFIHEITHVHQDYQQRLRKDKDTEYRSYLDQNKNEFLDLINAEAGGKQLSPAEKRRLVKLYYASPQEIAAFSNQIALRAAEHLGIWKMTSVDEIQELRIDPGLIPGLVSMQIIANVQGSKNTSPKIPDKILLFVTRRYLKRAYQSLDAIRDTVLDAIRHQQLEKIQKSSSPAQP